MLCLGQPLPLLREDTRVFRISCQIGPLLGIDLHIIQFLGVIGITDVAPALAADGMVARIVGGDRRLLAGCDHILQLRDETQPVKSVARRQSAKTDILLLLDNLKALDLDKNTLIIFSSDNGAKQEFIKPLASTGSLRGCKRLFL